MKDPKKALISGHESLLLTQPMNLIQADPDVVKGQAVNLKKKEKTKLNQSPDQNVQKKNRSLASKGSKSKKSGSTPRHCSKDRRLRCEKKSLDQNQKPSRG